jgi:hypothetical protein
MGKMTTINSGYSKENQSHLKAVENSFYNAEVRLDGFYLVYQFKLRNVDGIGPCFLVKKESVLMKRLKVGLGLELKCWSAEKAYFAKYLKAKVKNISKQDNGPFKGHYLVGIAIGEEKDFDTVKPIEALFKKNKDLKNIERRRLGIDKRTFSNTDYSSERRSGTERRRGFDRRSGLERRNVRTLESGKAKSAKILFRDELS